MTEELNPKEKVRAILDKANETTGGSAVDLTEAVQALCKGFGQGGGGSVSLPWGCTKIDLGSFTLANDTQGNTAGEYELQIPHNLGVVPKIIILYANNYDINADWSNNRIGAFFFNTGTVLINLGLYLSWGSTAVTSTQNYYSFSTAATRLNESIFSISIQNASYPLRGGYKYEWIALA